MVRAEETAHRGEAAVMEAGSVPLAVRAAAVIQLKIRRIPGEADAAVRAAGEMRMRIRRRFGGADAGALRGRPGAAEGLEQATRPAER